MVGSLGQGDHSIWYIEIALTHIKSQIKNYKCSIFFNSLGRWNSKYRWRIWRISKISNSNKWVRYWQVKKYIRWRFCLIRKYGQLIGNFTISVNFAGTNNSPVNFLQAKYMIGIQETIFNKFTIIIRINDIRENQGALMKIF